MLAVCSDQPGAQPTSEPLLRLQYALCLIRLVNGVTDSAQKGKVAASVSSLATAAGVLETAAEPENLPPRIAHKWLARRAAACAGGCKARGKPQ